MPGRDGKGPLGEGPLTGWGRGPCRVGGRGERDFPGYGYGGRGRGAGRGRGLGRGYGYGAGFRGDGPRGAWLDREVPESSEIETELHDLRTTVANLAERLEEIAGSLKSGKRKD